MKQNILKVKKSSLLCVTLLLFCEGGFCQPGSEPKIVEMQWNENVPGSEASVHSFPKSEETEVEAPRESGMKPLRDGEMELVLTQKNASPILPAEAIDAGKTHFHPTIQRSYEPGFCLESPHFGVQADAYWSGRSDQLVQVVQLAEETRLEAELTASLWRQPLFTQPKNSGLEVPLQPTHPERFRQVTQDRSVSVLQPEFSGKRIRLRVVLPGTPEPVVQTLPPPVTLRSGTNHPEWRTNLPPENHVPCRFESFENEAVLTLEIQNPEDLKSPELTRSLRREIFHSVLYDGLETSIFPLWLQNGLADVFAGCAALTEKEPSGKASGFYGPLRLYDLPVNQDETQKWNPFTARRTISIVRYSLTSNDGKTFFPFWGQLALAYEAGLKNLEELQAQSQGRLAGTGPSLEAVERENQKETQKSLEFFFRRIESNPQNETFTDWFRTLNYAGLERELGAMGRKSVPVRIFWNPRVQVLNAPTDENGEFSKLELDDSWKSVFLEMAQVLKLVEISQNSPSGFAVAKRQVSGMVIHEFGNPKDFQTLTQGNNPEGADGASETEAQEEESSEVTPEDLQKLENVCDWFVKSPSAVTLNPDGTVLSRFLTPYQALNWFHPKNRAYLLQEFEGKTVLSATFNDDYVLHIILEKPENGQSGAEIRVLGIEQPENTGESDFENQTDQTDQTGQADESDQTDQVDQTGETDETSEADQTNEGT